MIKITFGSDEVKSAFVCKLRDLGINNINESTITVAVKAIRDGSGGAEAEVEFEQGVESLSPQLELVEAIKPGDDTVEDSPADTEEESSSTGSGLFTGGETS